MPPCHGGGQGFKSPSGRHYASVAQLVEQGTENPRVSGSIPLRATTKPSEGCANFFELWNRKEYFFPCIIVKHMISLYKKIEKYKGEKYG